MKLLCISNGHGEDVIALRILTPLRQLCPEVSLSVLPIAGAGNSYRSANLPVIGPARSLPSGGFLNRDPQQLARDLQGGLLGLTRSQLAAIKTWAKTGDAILAVGDVVPLLFAYLSGLPYAFVGTAKSEYWLRDEQGKLPATNLWNPLEGWSGSVYLPWERWLMSRDRCRAVFVRDALTAKQLEHLGVRAKYAGNPMMDGLSPTGTLSAQPMPADALTIALLPGSRPPEAYDNFARMLATLPGLIAAFGDRPLTLLAAIAPSLSLHKLQAYLSDWQFIPGAYPAYTRQTATIVLISDAYNDCLDQAEIAIATAGTAAEQFVGLGKPVITLPGKGPQFTPAFATVQAKMLGPSVQMIDDLEQVGMAIAQIMRDPDRLRMIDQNGKQRMGESGAGDRIAQQLTQALLID
ncbi:lipid-A-disaccharide synthase-related protein [Leptolyngbya sp. BC1307]|uniref:lipid-A-disaccharide synthase-related protein n=1 Tax=Leptolyngbya sp. BC1307 TaxID=2029589 RepID=UPI000EFDAB32|nr:lipid-A-disaccharide synthase-related protein [Leptolyngbya sp. BC1307]